MYWNSNSMQEESANSVRITINGLRQVAAPAGVSLLQALRQAEIFVPSACGGRGICGLCRVRVEAGAPEAPTDAELNHLGEAERRDKFRLACQVKARDGLRIQIPESFFGAREYQAEVASIRDLTSDIREVKLVLRAGTQIAFKSGQYIQFRIPPYGLVKRLSYRAYSIASPPSQKDAIELEIRRVRAGIGTTYIFEHLKVGDRAAFNGPHGDFYLRDTPLPAVMIAGGSGMAPMKSMLAHMRDRKVAKPTRYFFGAQASSGIFLEQEMRAFEKILPDFRFIPCVNTVGPGEKWAGETGLVPAVVERLLEKDFPGEVYLCGSPAMISACLGVLARKNVSPELIYYDKFA